MGTTKEWYYGRAQRKPSQGTSFTINHQAGRSVTIEPTVNNLAALTPNAALLRYTGYGVLQVVNVDATNAIDLQDNDGTTIVSIPALNLCRLSLLDNSTAAGVWKAIVKPFNAAEAPPSPYLLWFGGDTVTADESRRFDVDQEAWVSLTTTFTPGLRDGTAFRIADKAYGHGGTPSIERNSIRSYVVDTYTNLTDGNQTETFGGSSVLDGKGVCYHDLNDEVEEYDKDGDSWAALNDYHMNDNSSQNATIGLGSLGYVYFSEAAPGSGDRWVEHNHGTDAYTALTNLPSEEELERTTLFVQDSSDEIHILGGAIGSGSTIKDQHHYWCVSAGVWVSTTVIPEPVFRLGTHSYSNMDTKALCAHGSFEDATNRSFVWDNMVRTFTNLNSIPDAVTGMENQATTVPQ